MPKKQTALILLATFGLLFFGPGNYWSSTWLSKWSLLMAWAALGVAFFVGKRTSFWHFPLIFYALLNLLHIASWVNNPYQGELDPLTLLALQKNALYGVIQVSAASVLFASVTRRWGVGIGLSLAGIWAFGTFATLALPWTGNQSPPNNGLWFGNPSMGAGLLACLLPFIYYATSLLGLRKGALRVFVVGWVLTLFMIYRTQASVPWGVLGVATAALLMSQNVRKRPLLVLGIVPLLAISMIAVGWHFLGVNFWENNGRFEMARMAWTFFRSHGSPSLGFGYASTQVLNPLEQVIMGQFKGDYFLWLHNDWLQLMIEGGWIGMVCVVLSFGRIMCLSWRWPAIFGSLMGFATLGLFNYPLRMPIHSYCLVLICGLVEALARPQDARKPGLEPGEFASMLPSSARSMLS